MSTQEKPQWTTKQVIALIITLSGIIGIGGAKTYDTLRTPIAYEEKKSTTKDTMIAELRGDISNVFNEIISMRQENRSEHVELREDIMALHNRIRQLEKRELAEIKLNKIYAKKED